MIKYVLKDVLCDEKYSHLRIAVLIILLGFSIRLFSFHYTYIINPDGVLYIHQARAIYYGLKDSVLGCSLSFLSNYPILIVPAYKIFGDWVIAARSVSILFGTLTLIPVYLLLRKFLERQITQLAILIFSLIPVFVDRSVDVVRDPVYWFFLSLGLYLFVYQIKRIGYLFLIVSNLSFLMAAWARIEAMLFLLASLGFIPFIGGKGRIKRLSVFAMPLALLVLAGTLGLMISGIPVKNLHRTYEVTTKITEPMIEYKRLRANLTELMHQPLEGNLPAFLHKARNLVWLIAIGTVLTYMVRAFFYPFFLIFLIGLGGIWRRIRGDTRLQYLSVLSILALVLLLTHTFHTWMMFNRFWAVFILPSFIIMGFGIRKITSFLKARLNLREPAIISILCALILASSLPKNLKSRETDKIVFKEIGELLAERDGNNRVISVAAVTVTVSGWVSFYANLEFQGAPCPHKNAYIATTIGTSYEEFVENLRKKRIKYFLWEEKGWPKGSFDLIEEHTQSDFLELGRWSHPDTGKMILFELI